MLANAQTHYQSIFTYTKDVDTIPELPRPEMARPTIHILEDVAKPEMRQPSSKMKTPTV